MRAWGKSCLPCPGYMTLMLKYASADLVCLFCVLRIQFWNALPQLLLRHLIFQPRNIAQSKFSQQFLYHVILHHILNCNFSTDLKGTWTCTQLAVHAKLFCWARSDRRINPQLNWGLVSFIFQSSSVFAVVYPKQHPLPQRHSSIAKNYFATEGKICFTYSALTQ